MTESSERRRQNWGGKRFGEAVEVVLADGYTPTSPVTGAQRRVQIAQIDDPTDRAVAALQQRVDSLEVDIKRSNNHTPTPIGELLPTHYRPVCGLDLLLQCHRKRSQSHRQRRRPLGAGSYPGRRPQQTRSGHHRPYPQVQDRSAVAVSGLAAIVWPGKTRRRLMPYGFDPAVLRPG